MANPLVFEIFYNFTDAEGESSKVSFFVDSATDITDVLAVIPLLGDLLDTITNGAITSAGVTLEIDVVAAGFQGIAAAISDVQEGLQMGFRSFNGFLKTLRIPTILEDIFVAGSKDADLTDAGVDALVDALISGIDVDPGAGTSLVTFTDVRGEDLITLEYAREKFREG